MLDPLLESLSNKLIRIIVVTRMMGTDGQADGLVDRRTDAGDDNNPSAEEDEG